MTRKERLLEVLKAASKRVAAWPEWKRDAADKWVAQLKKDSEIEKSNLLGWGPFDQ